MFQERFSEIVQEKYGITADVIADAQKLREEKGGRLDEILVNRKTISEAQRLEVLSHLLGIPFWPDLPLDDIDNSFTETVSIQFLKQHTMVPLQRKAAEEETAENASQKESDISKDSLEGYLGSIVAVNDVVHFHALDDLVRLLNLDEYKVVLSTREAIRSIIDIFYDLSRDSAEQLVQDMEEDGSEIISELEETADLLDDTSDAPIIKLVNHIISQSIKARASDIHIEPYQDHFKVRYRVDGILYDLLTPPKWIQPALISRIKVMSKMNIAEKRLPQDGRFAVKIGPQEIDLRISTLPTAFGERVVMRLLNKTISLLKVSELGLAPDQQKVLDRLVKATTAITAEEIRKGSTPISTSRVMAPAESLVCKVEKTRCPVKADWTAISAVSLSRISPTRITSGS